MKTDDIFSGKKEIIVEFFIGILVVVGVYYLLTIIKDGSAPVTTSINGTSVGSDFNVLLQDLDKNGINFSDKSFLDSPLFKQMKPFYNTILPSDKPGKINPFASYAATRSSN
jgi:hypothetical protein